MTGYPSHWEADVLLSDGGTGHLRPIRPEDADALVAMHARLSPETIYMRFFAPYPVVLPRDLERFTHVDHDRRVAFILQVDDALVAVGRYEGVVGSDTAEVAFIVQDDHQGRGIGSVLLEHLAAAGQERGIRRFEADVLSGNRAMLGVFLEAGYTVSRQYESGTVQVAFDIAPTERSVEVMRAREHRAEARSIGRLLRPRGVAVVGASRDPAKPGGVVIGNLLAGGFEGTVAPIHRKAKRIRDLEAYRRVQDAPGPIDLAVVCTPPATLPEVVEDCATAGVHGLMVLTDMGSADADRELAARVRKAGMRLIGPAGLGVLRPAGHLNASLVPRQAAPGSLGFFAQSDALGIALLDEVGRRGLGISSFVSAGARADVSGNDLLQYWEDDPDTAVVLLYLETFGNPRKFGRLARRLGRVKPVVAVTTGVAPVTDALLAQAGVVRATTVADMLDSAALLDSQPLPEGDRVGVVSNSRSLARLVLRSLPGVGLTAGHVEIVPVDSGAEQYRPALQGAVANADALIAVFVPPLGIGAAEVGAVVAETAASSGRPIAATFLGQEGLVPELGTVPSYSTPESAVQAMGRVREHARWRSRPPGTEIVFADVDLEKARTLTDISTSNGPASGGAGGMSGDVTREGCEPLDVSALLTAYGIQVVPAYPAADADEAVEMASRIGWPVVLKTTDPAYRHRSDLGAVRLDLANADQLRAAWEAVTEQLRAHADARKSTGVPGALVVQKMAPPGVPVVIGAVEEPHFGPLVSFAVGGIASELLGDTVWRLVPLMDADAEEMVRAPRAAPMLSGYRGAEPADLAGVQELLLRVARLKDDLPEVSAVELNPVLVTPSGLHVLGAAAEVGPPVTRLDYGPRRML
ncbi:MAG TPA: GNAT family N-acetyltransferase [Frankiaceae bacterium]|nr:GNAT family N-acetyltransferase [Frankiaceae bacterium]